MKNNTNTKILVLLLMTICGIVYFFYIQAPHEQSNNVSVEIANVEETSSIDPALIMSDTITYTTTADHQITLPDSYFLDVPYISQYPELPTGCEITSLTEVLLYYGYDVDKETLAAEHLPMKDYIEPGCFINYFYGSPWSEHGSGCFSPALVTAANSYLQSVNSNLHAISLNYASVNALFNEITKGHPVIVWTCFNLDSPEVTYNDIDLGNGQTFSWPANEHCTVLTGFNFHTNTVTLADPTYGTIERSMDEFSYNYKMYFYQAAVLQ